MRAQIMFWLFFIPFCLVNSKAHISVVNGYCLGHQRSMLLHLKNNMIFNTTKSSKLVHWNQSESGDDCCQWHGVTCNKRLVIALDLSQESISGGLNNSSSLFSLQYLQSLNLALNDFYPLNIPPQLHKLKNLRYLNLSNAGFEGQIPKEISQLRRLVILDLSSNYLEGPIPDELMQLKALIALNLSHNALWGYIPSSMGNLKNLESLDLSNNSFSGGIPSELSSLSFLTYLNLSFNHLVGSIPSGHQFSTFIPDCFIGNEGLCGPPLTNNCSGDVLSPLPPPHSHTTESLIDWNFLSVESGFFFGFGIFILPLICWKKWKLWYSEHVDDLLYRFIHKLDFEYVRHEGITYRILRWVH